MNLKTFVISCLLVFSNWVVFAQDENDVLSYIETYKSLAIAEQLRSGVPAAITLAQGIHESAAGKSELATKGNNHFGIKCKSTWMGETILHDDDKKQECFRKYVSAEQSYIDHSDFLKGSNRYHFLFDLEKTDYAGWASGLKRAGYATNPAYVKRLTDLVEKYNLQQYTYEGISNSNGIIKGEVVPNDDQPKNLTHIDDPSTYYKGLKGFWASKGETLLPKALEKNIRYAKLLALNDLADEPLSADLFIFIEKKRKIGTEEFHIVKENETMHLISQKEAMLLSNLYAYNNLTPGQEPEVGERLSLQYKSYDMPKTKQRFLNEFEQPKKVEPVIARVEERKIEPKPVQKVIIENPIPVEAKVEEIIREEAPPVIVEPIQEKIIEPEKTIEQKVVEEPIQKTEVIEEKVEPIITSNEDILNAEKAARIEQLLSSKPLEAKTETIVIPEPQPVIEKKEEPIPPVEKEKEVIVEPIQEVQVIETTPPVIETPAPPQIKRTYNEPGIDDSVKDLKKKFDKIVYSPRPIKKVDTVKKIEIVNPKPSVVIKKTETATIANKPIPKKVDDKNTKVEDKKSNVQVTKTGIKRDIKKETESKDSKSKDSKVKKEDPKKSNAKKQSASDLKKADAKKNDAKKISDAKKKADDKKKTDAKKKADLKKKETPKKKK